MDTATESRFVVHARAVYPREAVAFLILANGKYRLHICENVAPVTDGFMTTPEDWAAAESQGQIIAVIHSHPDQSAEPSEADLAAAESEAIDWIICGFPNGKDGDPVWHRFGPRNPGEELPYLERRFVHGVTDCFTLIRDYYWREFGIDLPNVYRPDEWWLRGQNLYVDYLDRAGFDVIARNPGESYLAHVRPGDGLLFNIGSAVPNHAAIWIGDNRILHHLYGRLSSIDMMGRFYIERLTHVCRHRDVVLP